MSADAASARRLPTWFRRWLLNLVLLLALTLAYSVASSLIAVLRVGFSDFPSGLVPYIWLLTSYLLLPGTLLYLLLLELFPGGWSKSARRILAIALSPLMAASLWFYFPTDDLFAGWRLAFATPLIYAAFVRLRPSA